LGASILAATSIVHAADPQSGGFDGFASAALGAGDSRDNGSFNDRGLAKEAQLSLGYTSRIGLGGQLDDRYFKQDYKNSNADSGIQDIAEHLYYRSQGWLAGAFAQQRQYVVNGNRNGVKSRFLGVEGQVYLDNMTLYGQLGQARWHYQSGGDSDPGPVATIELRYFAHDNLRLDGSVNYMKEDFGSPSNDKWNQTTYGVGAEYRFTNNPLSVFTRVEYVDEGSNYAYSADSRRIMFGVNVNFGKDSLRKRDRNGAGLKPVAKDLFFGFTT
jgi:hypothetical protein